MSRLIALNAVISALSHVLLRTALPLFHQPSLAALSAGRLLSSPCPGSFGNAHGGTLHLSLSQERSPRASRAAGEVAFEFHWATGTLSESLKSSKDLSPTLSLDERRLHNRMSVMARYALAREILRCAQDDTKKVSVRECHSERKLL
jgi:hypothetical protein